MIGSVFCFTIAQLKMYPEYHLVKLQKIFDESLHPLTAFNLISSITEYALFPMCMLTIFQFLVGYIF